MWLILNGVFCTADVPVAPITSGLEATVGAVLLPVTCTKTFAMRALTSGCESMTLTVNASNEPVPFSGGIQTNVSFVGSRILFVPVLGVADALSSPILTCTPESCDSILNLMLLYRVNTSEEGLMLSASATPNFDAKSANPMTKGILREDEYW